MTARRLRAVPDSSERTRAVAYIRVSTVGVRQAEQFHSPDLQHAAIAELLTRRGLLEVARVEDIDRTGRDFNREGIQQVLTMARQRQVDVVALYNLSRLGRNTAETLRVIVELRQLGVTVISASENVDDTPEGQFMLTQFLSMAQLYSDQRGQEWARVHAHMAKAGRQVGQPPLGYVQEDTGRVTARGRRVHAGPMTVDPNLGPVVAQAFVDYAAGERVRDIAARLTVARGGGPVWPAQVRAMMRNPFYAGLVRYKGREFPGVHERLVDDVTWAKVQRRVARDAVTPSRRLAAASSLTGLAVCDACNGRAELRSTREGKVGRVERLGCPRQAQLRACGGCGAPRVSEVEAAVLEWAGGYLAGLRLDDVAQAERRARRARAQADAQRLRAELRRTEQTRTTLVLDRARRDITAEQFNAADAALLEAEQRLRGALAEAEETEGLPPRRAAAAVAEVLELWPLATPAERNRMLRRFVKEVRLRAGSRWREPVADRVQVIPL